MAQPKRGKAANSGEALRRFSLALYARPNVAEALIALQDRAGCEVNLLLFALWLGATRGHRLDPAELTAAAAAITPISGEIVAPLRQLRRRLKPDAAPDAQDLRRRIAGLELAAERRLQHRLAAAVSQSAATDERAAAAEANLALVLGAEAKSPESAVLRDALAGLMRRW